MLVLLAMAAWAEGSGRDPALMTVGEGTAPAGISTQWVLGGCNVVVRINNATAAPVEVDWNRSAYAQTDSAAVGLVPGSASKQSSMLGMPPTVVPAGAFAEEILFRKDRLPIDSDGCLIETISKAAVTLSVSGGWVTQALEFRFDWPTWLRERPVLDFRSGRVCLQHERRQDADPCYPNSSPKSAKEAADKIAAGMRVFGCSEDSILVVTEAVMRGPTSAGSASRAYRKCVLGSVQ